MPKKIAIFVEGLTEQIFVDRFIREIIIEKDLHIDLYAPTPGNTYTMIQSTAKYSGQKYYVLLFNCSNDEKVVSDIRDRYKNLFEKGYESIVGLRDVYPTKKSDISKLEKKAGLNIPTKNNNIKICFAVMEIEAWFIAETKHFSKIDVSLNIETIRKTLNFDPSNDNIEDRYHPAQDLHDIYQTVNKSYLTASGDKKRNRIERTVNALDFSNLYTDVRERVDRLGRFVKILDEFFV